MNIKKLIKNLFLCLLIVIFFLGNTGCSNKDDDNDTLAIVTINGDKVFKEEMMLYLLQIKSEFEQLGGKDVWDIEDFSGGKTANEVARQGALENLIKVKLLVKSAGDMNIALTDDEKEETKERAKEYFGNIEDKYLEDYNITKEIVINTFLEYQLTKKITDNITSSYKPTEDEIYEKMLSNEDYAKLVDKDAKDVLTQIKVKHIVTKTHIENEQGELIPLSVDEQKEAYEKIQEAYFSAINGKDFDRLIEQYSEDELKDNNKGVYDFSKALMTIEYREELENVAIGGISSIVNSQYGYHIFKVIDKSQPSEEEIKEYKDNFIRWEDTLKKEYEEILKNEAFVDTYQDLKLNADIDINSEEWNKIKISNNN